MVEKIGLKPATTSTSNITPFGASTATALTMSCASFAIGVRFLRFTIFMLHGMLFFRAAITASIISNRIGL